MINLLKAELYKFKRNFYIWIVLLVMLLCYFPSLFGNTSSTFEVLIKNIEKDVMVILIALSIYSGLTLSNDFSNRTIMHYVSAGHRRSQIIISKFLNFYLTCIIIIVLYFTMILIFSSFIMSFPIWSNISILVCALIKSVVLYSGFMGMFFLISILSRRGTVSMGICITFSILAVVVSNILYISPDSIWRINPLIQLQSSNSMSFDIAISSFISILILIASLLISICHFKYTEIK